MFEVMMTTPNMNEYPAIGFEFGNDVPTFHTLIIHTIHTSSTFGKQPANETVEKVNLQRAFPGQQWIEGPVSGWESDLTEG
jgi:hypothetical protein